MVSRGMNVLQVARWLIILFGDFEYYAVSDFGSHVSVYRTDREKPSEEDKRRVQAAAKSLQFTARDRIGPYDEFDLHFGGAHDVGGVEGIAVFLSRYWIGDDEANDGLDPEVIMAREAPVVEQFAQDLERLLGGDFETAPYSGDH